MSERMVFLPKSEVLGLDELVRLAGVFIGRGVERIRITGGEPLVRRDVVPGLIEPLSRYCGGGGLTELTLTTNGMGLCKYAGRLFEAGVRRVNVSLDSLDSVTYSRITRGGDVVRAVAGIEAALSAGLDVKLNVVVLGRDNRCQIVDMIEWAHERGLAITLIEVMPLGETGEDRLGQYVPLTEVRAELEEVWHLRSVAERTGGPARYVRVEETGGLLGFITPLTGNFCDGCNRVRVTCTGGLYSCLGHEGRVDLRGVMRASPDDDGPLNDAIDAALASKPRRHEFEISSRSSGPVLSRHMSVTGG